MSAKPQRESAQSPAHSLRKLRKVIDEVATAAGFDLPIATIEQFQVFLATAEQILIEGQTTQVEVGRIRGRPRTSIQRCVKNLTGTTHRKTQGLGLVEEFADYTNLRLKPLKLTAKGMRTALYAHEQLLSETRRTEGI